MIDQRAVTVVLIDVEREPKILAEVIADAGPVAVDVIGAIWLRHDNAGPIAVVERADLAPGLDVHWTVQLLRDRAGNSGLDVVRLIVVVRVLDASSTGHGEARAAEQDVREIH